MDAERNLTVTHKEAHEILNEEDGDFVVGYRCRPVVPVGDDVPTTWTVAVFRRSTGKYYEVSGVVAPPRGARYTIDVGKRGEGDEVELRHVAINTCGGGD